MIRVKLKDSVQYDPIDPQRRWILWILQKQQNWIQNDDSLAQKFDQKPAVYKRHKVRAKDINYLFVFLKKKRNVF